MLSASERIAEVAAAFRPSQLPARVVAATKRHLLDVVGVALASSPLPFAQAVLRTARGLGGRGEGSVIGCTERLPSAWAALVNGALAHGIDYDDTHQEGVVHVSCSIMPAALAAGEAAGADGARFLAAVALGMETAVRLGVAAPGAFHDRGFHPTGVCGAFAATVTAAALAGLTRAQLVDALGLSGSMAGGLLEFLSDGTWSKRIHAGWAAHGGLTAARLAAEGFAGPRQVLDGRFGFFRRHLGDSGWDLDTALRGFGTHWRLLEIALKPYPACHMTHAFLDCAAALRAEIGSDPEAITRVECFIHPREMPIVCEPRPSKLVPQTDYDAKFSLPYTVASMLVRGHVDLDDFTSAAIADPAVLALAARVECLPDADADYPRTFPGRLRVRLRDGRVLEHDEPVNRGSAERPLSDAEVREKFQRNAARALSEPRAAAIVAAIAALDRAPRLEALAAACRGEA